eukprot:5450462-Pyramimonas_sp.AAC.1
MHRYILTIGFAAAVKVGLDTDTVELTVKTLLSRLVTREFNSPANSSAFTAPTTGKPSLFTRRVYTVSPPAIGSHA